MNNKELLTSFVSYEKWLINSLKNKEEAIGFIETAFEEFQKDRNFECLLLSMKHVVKAQEDRE